MAAAPVLIPEYVFMWSFLIAFLGAIFFAMTSLINMEPSTIILNNNVRFFFNLIIGCAGVISMFVWFNMEIPALTRSVMNPKVVKSNINN
jgi:hypothetical protein